MLSPIQGIIRARFTYRSTVKTCEKQTNVGDKNIGGGRGGAGGGGGGAEAPLNKNLGGSAPLRFGSKNIGNESENWFGKIFRLVIFSQIVS